MWKIFLKKETSIDRFLNSVETWKKDLFDILSQEVKEYFAQKVVTYFDNNMMFQQKRGMHINLMEALSNAEKDMLYAQGIFQPVKLYWLKDYEDQHIITFGLEDDKDITLENYGFKLLKSDAVPLNGKEEELDSMTWSTTVFNVELVNYVSGWIDYIPSMDRRSILQTEYILMSMHFKKTDLNLLEKMEFEQNIQSHPQYKELYEKILRIMPKIENVLEQEWKTNPTIQVQALEQREQIKNKKKI